MLFLLSPSKSLSDDAPDASLPHTLPQFRKDAVGLIAVLRQKTPEQVASLINLSDKLAALNVARYQVWSPTPSAQNSKQAVLAFHGDVYKGLDAASLTQADLAWAQDHLLILSGLYGLLRPLDWMQDYRLEMGTQLGNARGKDLYAFWQSSITQELNARQVQTQSPVVVNLASLEYFKAVDTKALQARVVQCVFEEYKSRQYKVVSFYAKRARGLMMRYAIQNRAATPQDLKKFKTEGYAYDAAASKPDRLVFRRKQTGYS